MNSGPTGDKPQTPLDEALALHRAGKHELAMQRYVAILQQNPGHIDALHYVAVLAIQQGQIAEGIKVIRRALEVGPPQARTLNLLGQAHLRLNQDDDALAAFTRAIECDAGFVDAYGNRATLLAEMGRFEDAVADFDRALALRPDNAEDLCNRAGALANLGRTDEALMGFSRAIALMPDLAPAWFNRGNVLLRLNRADEALRDYDRTVALAPGMAAAHEARGKLLQAMGRPADAKASLEHAAALKARSAPKN
jgi:tetratricopeptide (TPR) repeat protein